MVSTNRGIYVIGGWQFNHRAASTPIDYISKYADGNWSRFGDLLTGHRAWTTSIPIGNNEFMIFGGREGDSRGDT